MVAPRRQTARLPKPTNLEVDAEQDETMDDDFESDALSESEGEGSDWEGKTLRTTTGKAPAKRAKLTSGSSSRKQPKVTRGKKSLGLLLDMPLDILFEILSLLPPKDLVNLTRTSKPLRETLMTRNAVTVWKAARETLGIPECPSDFSEPKWAVLLSGSNCQTCGAKNVFKVDFRLRRRVCTKCKKDNLVVTSKFAKEYPKLDPIILNFTPYTNVGGWAHGHASGSRFYWKADIEYVSREWERLQKNLQTGAAGAKEKINEFKLARIDLVDEINKYADVCEEWVDLAASQRLIEVSSKKDKRYNAIIEKFKALGYIDVDIQTISMRNECTQSTELTDKIWKRIRPILEPMIQQSKASRLAKQRKELIRKRMVDLKTAYQSYLKTLVPSQWIYQPFVEDVAKFSVFDQLLNADEGITISAESFQGPISMLPGLISTWMEQRKTDLRKKLPPSVNTKQVTGTSAAATIDLLDLATSVFECASNCAANMPTWGQGYGNPLFGWDGVVPHRCKVNQWSYPDTEVSTDITFSKKGSAATAKLIVLAGLDVASATPADMDKKDLRFFCAECGFRSFMNSFGRCAYTWRSGVAHYMTHTHKTEIVWCVLTAGEIAVVTKPEATDPIQGNACWTCNHCSIYLDSWETRPKIVEHLEKTHHITNAKEPDDLFFLPNLRRSPLMVPFFITSNRTPENSTQDILCRHCDPSIKRLFKISGVIAHLWDKHKVHNPFQGKDWAVHNK